jgi:hypothetical protein
MGLVIISLTTLGALRLLSQQLKATFMPRTIYTMPKKSVFAKQAGMYRFKPAIKFAGQHPGLCYEYTGCHSEHLLLIQQVIKRLIKYFTVHFTIS